MLPPDDTIVAIATPLGRSAIGVVRLSGPPRCASPSPPGRRASRAAPRHLLPRGGTSVSTPPGEARDEAVAVWFPAPRSYTGEDVVEISTHGNPLLLEGVVRSAIARRRPAGAPRRVHAARGQSTASATLVQAEAVADVIDASTPAQARLAFDQLHGTLSARMAAHRCRGSSISLRSSRRRWIFPTRAITSSSRRRGRAVSTRVLDAIDALLAGCRPRARCSARAPPWPSSAGPTSASPACSTPSWVRDRAIVTAAPGTTRDLVTERVDVGGLRVTLVDTAGMREPIEPWSSEGVARSARARATAERSSWCSMRASR